MKKIRVLSCIPRQLSSFDEKLAWISFICEKYSPDILVTPQEFFGGVYLMPHQKSFDFCQLFPPLHNIARKYKVALVVGLVEKQNNYLNKEVIWFINERGKYLGQIAKIALPRYDHVGAPGYGLIEPEMNWENRFVTFHMQGINVAAIFCWEVFSNVLWAGLSQAEPCPDVVFNLIKFGVNSWPRVRKNKQGLFEIVDFKYGIWPSSCREQPWIDRLYAASLWEVKRPIICATNSWNLRPRSLPLCGTVSILPGQAENTLWMPQKKSTNDKQITEKIIVDVIDPLAIRAAVQNSFVYKEVVGQLPPMDLKKFAMLLKINRLERRLKDGTEQIRFKRKVGKNRGLLEMA